MLRARSEVLPEMPLGPLARPATTAGGTIIWTYALGVPLMHLAIPFALMPELFSWVGVAWLIVGNYLFCSLGIGACYHRLLTHRGFKCAKWLEHTLAILGVCCLQDSPARWVAIHRLHHNHSDEQPDPHSPLAGFFWGHVGWLFTENRQLSRLDTYEKYARDVLQDPFYLRIERNGFGFWIYFAQAALFLLAGTLLGWMLHGTLRGAVMLGLCWLVWGVLMRTIYTWHVTWAINSAAHVWGYCNYETGDNSRNNWLFALATNGEGWHNNHHADPRSAAHGHRWWELDVTYLTLRLLERVGLVWDIVTPCRTADLDQPTSF
jgi:stearoyl-CoA desaturase (delta-9 desaturase)